MKRAALLMLSTAVLALVIAPSVGAGKPSREIFPPLGDFTTSTCGFPVLIHSEGQSVVTTFTDKDGNVRRIETYPGSRQTFTNLQTGATVLAITTGPAFWRFDPDGSASLTGTGLWSWLGHPVTGAAGIYLSRGRFILSFDPEGNEISSELVGGVVDLCAALAP